MAKITILEYSAQIWINIHSKNKTNFYQSDEERKNLEKHMNS